MWLPPGQHLLSSVGHLPGKLRDRPGGKEWLHQSALTLPECAITGKQPNTDHALTHDFVAAPFRIFLLLGYQHMFHMIGPSNHILALRSHFQTEQVSCLAPGILEKTQEPLAHQRWKVSQQKGLFWARSQPGQARTARRLPGLIPSALIRLECHWVPLSVPMPAHALTCRPLRAELFPLSPQA